MLRKADPARDLARSERAGRHVYDEVRRTHYAFVREHWLALSLTMLALLTPNGIDVLVHSPFQRGAILGITTANALLVPMALVVFFSGTAPRMMGGDAERWTAEELTPIQQHGYRVIHHAGLGRGDIDHVLVGPGGLFVIETKWSGSRWNLERPSTYAEAALAQVRREARRMALFVHAHGEPHVTPVLVLWGRAAESLTDRGNTVRRLPDGTLVMPGSALRAWTLRLGRNVLSDNQTEAIWNKLSIQTEGRDATETPPPRSFNDFLRELARVFGAVVLSTLIPVLVIPRSTVVLDLSVLCVTTLAALMVRRRAGWRVAGTASVTVSATFLGLILAAWIAAG